MNKRIYIACIFTIVVCMAMIHLLFHIGNVPFNPVWYPCAVLIGVVVLVLSHVALIVFESKTKRTSVEIHNNGIMIEFSESKCNNVEIYASNEGVTKLSTKQKTELSNWLKSKV